MKKPYYSLCVVMRVKEVRHFRLGDPEGTPPFKTETVTEPCGAPLFGDDFTATGICRSCARGWEVPTNRRATPEEIRAARAQKAMP